MPPARLIGQKSACHFAADEDCPETKRFNGLRISIDEPAHSSRHTPNIESHEPKSKKKRKKWISPESDPEATTIKDFEYIWRTKSEEDAKEEITGCECGEDECARGICKCAVGNVRLTEEVCVKNPVRLSRHFYDSNFSECSNKCRCKGKCALRFRTARSQYVLVVRKCENEGKGFGVFTKDDIPAGAFVCELSGKFLSYKEWRVRAPSPYVYCFNLKNKWHNSYADVKQFFTCIDARQCGNESRFINHSCNPNLCLLRSRNHYADHLPTRILMIAKRKISAGEELTFCYGRTWLGHMRQENRNFKCLCRSSVCFMPSTDLPVDLTISYKNKQLHQTYEMSDDEDDEEEELQSAPNSQ